MPNVPERKTVEAKKKVIALVVDTHLTNEQLERGTIQLIAFVGDPGDEGTQAGVMLEARNVRVLDSD